MAGNVGLGLCLGENLGLAHAGNSDIHDFFLLRVDGSFDDRSGCLGMDGVGTAVVLSPEPDLELLD